MDDARAVANKSTGPGCVQWANAHLVHMLNQFSKYIYIYIVFQTPKILNKNT